jgi:hypothetical protein
MKSNITVVTSILAFSLISCGEVMDLTPPEKVEVDYQDITLSLYQTGKYDLYLDNPEYQYSIMVEKSHCEKEARAELSVLDAGQFGEGYTLLPSTHYDLDADNLSFTGDDVLHTVNLRFHDLASLDGTKKYVLGLKLVSNDLAVDEARNTMTFYLQQKQGDIGNPYIITTVKDLQKLNEYLKDGQTTYVRLGTDLNLQDIDWTPVETTAAKQIDFDGCGHVLSNLKVTASSSTYQGFFGMLTGKCANVEFSNAQITANTKLAGIVAGQVGNASGTGTVQNVKVSGTINLTSGNNAWDNGQAGGVCGRLHGVGSKIYQCGSETTITATWSAGGICGEVRDGAIVEQCYHIGDITTQSCIGGIASRLLGSSISNCYSHGIMTAYPMVVANPGGGIAGWVQPLSGPSTTSMISYCWSDCTVYAQNQVGGIMGNANNTTGAGITVHHCVAWNTYLYSNGAPRSGKVCGRYSFNVAYSCYANPAMECRFSATTPALPDQTSVNTSSSDAGDAYAFNGLTTIPNLMDAVSALSWDTSVWDLDGAQPRLKWELN